MLEKERSLLAVRANVTFANSDSSDWISEWRIARHWVRTEAREGNAQRCPWQQIRHDRIGYDDAIVRAFDMFSQLRIFLLDGASHARLRR